MWQLNITRSSSSKIQLLATETTNKAATAATTAVEASAVAAAATMTAAAAEAAVAAVTPTATTHAQFRTFWKSISLLPYAFHLFSQFADSRLERREEEEKLTLVIHRARLEDSGVYSCEIQHYVKEGEEGQIACNLVIEREGNFANKMLK